MSNSNVSADWTKPYAGLSGEALELAKKVPPTAGESFADSWRKIFAELIERRGSIPDEVTPESLLDLYPQRSRGSWFFTAKDVSEDSDLSCLAIDFEEDAVYATLHTRQGGGNRECYCDDDYDYGHESGCLVVNNELLQEHENYIIDYDDSFDSTYANFIYKTELTVESLKEMQAINAERNRLLNQLNLIEEINIGKKAPWSILADGEERKRLSEKITALANDLRKNEYNFNADQLEYCTDFSAFIKKVLNFEDVKNEVYTNDNVVKNAAGLERNSFFSIGSTINDAISSGQNLQKWKAIRTEAEELAEGPLREYLLGDRGTGSYKTKEKRGHRNVEVTKTYERGTVVGKEVESAERSYSYSEKSLEKILALLESRISTLTDARNAVAKLKLELETVEAAFWQLGWPGLNELLAPEGKTL